MNKSALKWRDIDAYHAQFSKNIQAILQLLRKAIMQAAPGATETISYGMPAFKQNKMLVYYAVCKEHIGFYPTPNPILIFKKDLEQYKTSKGAIQFPLARPLPFLLIKKIVKYRVNEDAAKDKSNFVKKPAVIGKAILAYNNKQATGKAICMLLAMEISKKLPGAENKIWHGHPVWFLEGNPIAGYSNQKAGIRLMFWSGAGFNEEKLNVRGEKFKDASLFYPSIDAVNKSDLKRWLGKAKTIQWDYKNIIKRKGKLIRLK